MATPLVFSGTMVGICQGFALMVTPGRSLWDSTRDCKLEMIRVPCCSTNLMSTTSNTSSLRRLISKLMTRRANFSSTEALETTLGDSKSPVAILSPERVSRMASTRPSWSISALRVPSTTSASCKQKGWTRMTLRFGPSTTMEQDLSSLTTHLERGRPDFWDQPTTMSFLSSMWMGARARCQATSHMTPKDTPAVSSGIITRICPDSVSMVTLSTSESAFRPEHLSARRERLLMSLWRDHSGSMNRTRTTWALHTSKSHSHTT
mmetsp:Transcript_6693/g.12365  ORF Transcript_6693/g.12365 Transcript_6693/m.12365 type:complete len:263 (+) Transcript_6693:529-1317(+)